MKILAFAATNSRNSINKQLVNYATNLIDRGRHEIEIIDLNDYELPLYSQDRETEFGLPERAQEFINKIADSDAIVISFAEHNGTYTAAYKNLFDWASRITMKVYQGRQMVMLATSPGPGGASHVLQSAVDTSAFFGGNVVGKLSVPNFYEAFDSDASVLRDEPLSAELRNLISQLVVPNDSQGNPADNQFVAA